MDAKSVLRWGAQLGVSLALVAGVVWWAGPGELLHAVRTADRRWLAATAPVFVLVTALHGVRWWVLLRPVGRVPLHEAVLLLFVAKAVGLIVPLRAGAVLQVQLLGHRYELNRAAVAGTLVLEAVMDAGCFLALFIVTAPLLGAGRYLTAGVWAIAAVGAVAASGLFLR